MATGGVIPDQMKCVQHIEYGDARQVLSVVNDGEVPCKLKSNQVLVKIHAASINSFDWKMLNGNVSLIQKVSFPHIPG
jgi:NADPH:quinone reductase-like Zn-dependent oxidoreductase